jgi:hypothetical protein
VAVIESDYSLDDRILRLYKAGKRTSDIAQEIGKNTSYVCKRLRSMERYGEINRRSDGRWSAGKCALPASKRACGKAEFSVVSCVCYHCKYRRDRRP